jgi:hypothetical protein
MFAAGKTSGGSAAATPDPQFNYVTMLLHGDGTNGGQNNTFLDSSTNNFSITRNGNTTQGSFSPYGSNWSNFLNGSSYLSTSSSAISYAGNFTVECWFNTTTTTTYAAIYSDESFTDGGTILLNNGSNNGQITVYMGSISNFASTSTGLNDGKWHHVALSRSSSTVRLFIDGALENTTTASGTITTPSTFRIGNWVGLDRYFGGYISNFRVTNTAVYTSSFTPSTTPLTAISGTSLLTCQSNRFIDNSSSPKTITVAAGSPSVQRFNPFGASTAYSTSVIGGSGYFDGSGDYLQVANDSAFDFSGDFTVECWLYLANTNNQTFISKGGHNALGPDAAGWALFIYTGQGLRFMTRNSGGTNIPVTVASTPQTNTWMHVAISRSGSNMRSFLNGTLVSTVTSSVNTANSSPFNIGANLNNLSPSTGYICDVRIIKGTAQYTATFTPPTAPLTAITDTQFLENFTNGAIFDNAMMNDLETVGNAQISTSQVKYGTGSLYFDGTGDYLSGPSTPSIAFGSGAYTVEFWLFKDSSGTGERGIFQTQTASLYGLSIFADGTTIYIDERKNAFSGTDPRISGTISQDTWIHVAVCRQTGTSGTLRAFVNGTQIGSSVTSNLRDMTSTGPINIGTSSIATNPLKGYIDDLRITNGFARYTANFTAPTAAFPNTGPV